ncbi:MAG: phage minor head protein [Cyclobacteriaceae bacterium]
MTNKIATAAINYFNQTGQILNLSSYKNELSTILKNSYDQTNTLFVNDQLQILKDQANLTMEQMTVDQLKTYLEKEAIDKANIQAATILKTMQSDLTSAVLGTSNINNSVSMWKLQTKNRTNPTIVNIQIQSTAENAKVQTTNFALNTSSYNANIKTATKTWIAIEDEKTRPAHAFANGQKVLINEYYFVGGEYLYYPGDMRGSPGNVINCRCSSLTLF